MEDGGGTMRIHLAALATALLLVMAGPRSYGGRALVQGIPLGDLVRPTAPVAATPRVAQLTPPPSSGTPPSSEGGSSSTLGTPSTSVGGTATPGLNLANPGLPATTPNSST